MLKYQIIAFLLLCTLQLISAKDELKVFTVASHETDGYKRYIRSAKHYGIEVTTLGMNEEWKGGDMNRPGGGYKINLLKDAVSKVEDKNAIIMFTDSFDVLFTSDAEKILTDFKAMNAKIVFGAEKFCWPDTSLEKSYPPAPINAARFLNSGLFIGYKPQIEKLLNDNEVTNNDDDQLYYTKIFLNEAKRKDLDIKLDTKSELFLNLNGAKGDIKLQIDGVTGAGTVENVIFGTTPSVLHGNGPSKISILNSFANYLAGTFDSKCVICEENNLQLDEENLPTISLSIFLVKPVPFLKDFWKKIENLNYPKNKINLFVHCHVPEYATTDKLALEFIEKHEQEYLSTRFIGTKDELPKVASGKQLAVDQAVNRKSDYLFYVDGEVQLDDPEILRGLLKYNRDFIAPVISKYDSLWSNFWGDLSSNGFYARSHDYIDIVEKNVIGMWNVPYISTGYLIKNTIFDKLNYLYNSQVDPDMSLCEKLRDEGVFMYVVNEKSYAHLIDTTDFDPTHTNPDLYVLNSNKRDWENRYLHPEFRTQLNESFKQMQPCTDVFWFKAVTEEFCDDLVEIMENFNQWSTGNNKDERIQGGYENVPTRDIHFKQVGLRGMWNRFMNDYIKPLSEIVYTGYTQGTPYADLQFVVRYKPDEQPELRPHHDASTYTVNIALNNAGTDYEGGGCRFVRYNCSVTDTKKGWMLMHPGRLTHYHEGLKVTRGTRYILVTFLNP